MKRVAIDPVSVPAASGGYHNAVEISQFSRLVVVSGQIPVSATGSVPDSFADQCRLVWSHLLAIADEAGMTVSTLVKATTYLSDRAFADENSTIRREVLGDHRPTLTVVIAEIYDPAWLLEIEGMFAE